MKKLKILIIFSLLLTNVFANQVQVENFVERFYQTILKRHSEPLGLKNWTNELLSGEKAGSDIARGFIFSPEFQNRQVTNDEYITILYNAFFNRNPDSSGFNNWKNGMNNGMTEEDILDGFLNSLEFANLCQRYGISALEANHIDNNSTFNTKITIHNNSYSTHDIVGIFLKRANINSWGDNYINFRIKPNYLLSKPIEISDCSKKYDLDIVYENGKSFIYNINIKCGEEYHWGFNDKGIKSKFENIVLYNQKSRYKNYLKECPLYNLDIANSKSCKLSQLPLIAQESNTKIPTKQLIMSRVVVSQKWMGDRFSELLDIFDSDIRELLGAVTAIVIDEDINPSKYKIRTGAIYLDPRGLWLTPEEAETIVDKDDFRIGYGSGLKFISFWRYIKNNSKYAYYSTDFNYKEHNTTRIIDDIKYSFARLLYHELAHANDFIPPNSIDELDIDKPISYITSNNFKKGKILSKKLYQESPLTSRELMDIGKVLYHGRYATQEQKDMSAEDIGLLFDNDVANELYGYSTPLEDFAMLFEATMMKYHYNFERDIGFIIKPTNENPTYRDYILGWGVRNRIANPNVSDRALFVAKSILPSKRDWDDFFAKDVGESKLLVSNRNWWDSIVINTTNSSLRKIIKVPDMREIYFVLDCKKTY